MILTLYGNIYDLTDFDHPGGIHMIELLTKSKNPELLIPYYHNPMMLLHILEKYQISGEKIDTIPAQDEEFKKFKKEVYNKISKKTISWYKNLDRLIHLTCYFLFLFIFYLLCLNNYTIIRLLIGGFLYSFCTIWTSHGNSHGHGWVWMSEYSTIFSGVASASWGVEHTVTHHVYTNDINHEDNVVSDPDVLLGSPVCRWNDYEPLYWFHRFQHYYSYPFILITGMYVPFNDFLCLCKNSFSSLNILHGYPLQLDREKQKRYVLQKIFYGIIFYIIPAFISWRSLGYQFIQTSFMFAVCGTSNFLINIMSHTNMKIKKKRYKNTEIMRMQLETTADAAPGNVFLNFITAGLSLQTIHHLCPNLPFTLYPKISLILQDYVKGTDMEYRVFPSYHEMLISHFERLKMLGRQYE